MITLYAFEIWFQGWEQERTLINHCALGKAKYSMWLTTRDFAPPGLKFTDLRGKKLGPPCDTQVLQQVQKYRGRPDLTAGKAVLVEGYAKPGAIVDAGSGCNFLVHFEDGRRLWAHPLEITTIEAG